jgi:hypothetical protein
MRVRANGATTEETRLGYLNMAVEWLDMADALDTEYGKISVTAEALDLPKLLRRSSS